MNEIDKLSQDLSYAKTFSKYVRWIAWLAFAMITFWCFQKFQIRGQYPYPWALWLTWSFCAVYSAWMLFPWKKIQQHKLWKTGMIGYLILSFLFVFLLIGNVMVDAVIAGRAGVKLGVPGFEGTIMFLALSQVPGILFEKHPEMMV